MFRDPPLPPAEASAPAEQFGSTMLPARAEPRTDPNQRWKGVICEALIKGQFIPQASPVILQPGSWQKWEAFDWELLDAARTAVQQYGLHSPYTHQLLQYLFTCDILLDAQDIVQIASVLLSPSQQLIFTKAWRTLCEKEAAKTRQQGDPLFGITVQQLMGERPWADSNLQLRSIPEVHQRAQELAIMAISTLPESGKPHAFAQVHQGPNEPYTKFIDRLHHAIKQHPNFNEDLKEQMFKILAFENANGKTKQMLGILPKSETIEDMIELTEHATQAANAAYTAAAVREAIKPLLDQVRNCDKRCFNCGKKGHFMSQCRALQQTKKWCKICKQDNHNTVECRRMGNRKASVKPPRAVTQVQAAAWAASPQNQKGASTPSSPPLLEVPEWMSPQQ